MRGFTTRNALELYGVPSWGAGFFSINDDGHATVSPQGPNGPEIDLHALVESLRGDGMRPPMLVRFSDILARRIEELAGAFRTAIDAEGYGGRFRGVYPIKVNQQRGVVEEIVRYGAPLGVGLEAGSKPELLVSLALMDTPDGLIICNGYKDRAYVETALLAQRLGRTPVIVIDRFRELELVIKTSRQLGIRPHIGVRAKLSARGAGRWVGSTGSRSKFGLSPAELVSAVDLLRSEDMLDCFELLHFHIGSQITAIRAHKEALREASRIYVGLKEMGAALHILDVGGGLGVDYDGSKTNFHSSANYSQQEYANDVVWAVASACDEAGVAHPDIVTEAGRAMVAHHSVLVFDVLEVAEVLPSGPPAPVAEDDPKVLQDLQTVWRTTNRKNVHEAYHDALQLREEAVSLFALGYLDLAVRGRAERLFLDCCKRIVHIVKDLDYVPEDLAALDRDLADTYYGNFSVFQSAPDHWAVKQLFPVMPLQRLDERPTRRGVFADLTCDSDGKIDRFIDARDVKDVLPLHTWNGRPYYVGVFLVGAYQEILGDLHNLFGDTDAVHVRLGRDGGWEVERVVEGDDTSDVLRYVQYEPQQLLGRVEGLLAESLREGRISPEESDQLLQRYASALREYTYLTSDV